MGELPKIFREEFLLNHVGISKQSIQDFSDAFLKPSDMFLEEWIPKRIIEKNFQMNYWKMFESILEGRPGEFLKESSKKVRKEHLKECPKEMFETFSKELPTNFCSNRWRLFKKNSSAEISRGISGRNFGGISERIPTWNPTWLDCFPYETAKIIKTCKKFEKKNTFAIFRCFGREVSYMLYT